MPRGGRRSTTRPRGNGVGCGFSGGDGWGGPARGGGNRPAQPFGAGNGAALAIRPDRRERAERRRQSTKEMEELLYHLALHAEREETQLAAAVRLHDLYEGAPVAIAVTVPVNDLAGLSDDELRQMLADF